MNDDLIKREAVLSTIESMYERCTTDSLADYRALMLEAVKVLPYADRPSGEFTEREYKQFLHGISLSLLSKKSAQHWRYDEETAQEIRWLESLKQKVRARMKGADDE